MQSSRASVLRARRPRLQSLVGLLSGSAAPLTRAREFFCAVLFFMASLATESQPLLAQSPPLLALRSSSYLARFSSKGTLANLSARFGVRSSPHAP
jgi:hypothetical protein